ncbi:hypothetical protein BDV25DRAFT_154519 [Aspergillus avenaceus]|uniref:Filamentation protein n=1 Tax=Aspergillus avenaceus TaxID=36643 RepID=A0A5N6TWF8_ASPAV|nr:hypothetical protein BDV25DRAFT_154519 [Aspergillus avenaceus]
MAAHSDKGRRYIAALDAARSQNKWDEIPELIRKVTKHAPQKTCLLEVASAEYQLVKIPPQRSSSSRPSSASSTSALSELVPSLLSTVERAEGSPQDVLQAQVCLAWLHWVLDEPALAASRLPDNFGQTLTDLTSTGEELSPWTKVCLVKGCYFKGAAQRKLSGSKEALGTLESLVSWVDSQASDSPQFLHWSEKLAAESALVAGKEAIQQLPTVNEELMQNALRLLRAWSAHPNFKQGTSFQIEEGDEITPKSAAWEVYYDLLTAILQGELAYIPPTSGSECQQLASEIRRVESAYESSLLHETKFPTADSENTTIEEWVEKVIRNWEILCGPQWSDEDFGEGGQNAVGRNVLDILYRAATKTYHSHLILRRLFHVHSALADFDLALKALDSYIEIVVSAKKRAEKSAQYGELENDGTLLRTMSEGVTMLCCFGSAKEAEKARELTSLMKEFIEQHVQIVEGDDVDEEKILINAETSSTRSQLVSPADISAAYRGVGIGLANWANWTPVNEERDDIRAEAIDYLEKSTAPELEDETNYSSLYTLALLLAEDRDLDGAIDCVKMALTAKTHPGSTQGTYARERDLIPLWHLLALLLSAKQDFDIAERSCEAAFEQFPAAVTSLAHHDRRPQKQQAAQDLAHADGLQRTLIQELRGREKERIIETRMTQLAFVELLEGPEAAVNHSEQLLGLFATLFGDLNLEGEEKKPQTDSLRPQTSSANTVKSLRGSIFGRHRGPRAPKLIGPAASAIPNELDSATVNDEKHVGNELSQSVSRSDSRRLRKRTSMLKKPENTDGQIGQTNGNDAGANSAGNAEQPNGDYTSADSVEAATNKEQSGKQPLGHIAHNMNHKHQPPPTGHAKQPPEQDVRLPTSYGFDSPTRAVTKFPLYQAQKHALCILVKIWLLIAGLYRRAGLFEDAQEACDEASKHVSRAEALCAVQESSARSFRERGWASPKSVDELWADLLSEQGLLLKAQSNPHKAMERFEDALMRDSDHPKATICLANFLLDIWDETMTLQPPEPEIDVDVSMLNLANPKERKPAGQDEGQADRHSVAGSTESESKPVPPSIQDEEPKLLNRLAARDRAYGLLSALTKRGGAWDNSEAWYTLSRAYEAEGHVEKLKEVLWWCIELEDRRPIRHWSNIGSGVYVL